MDLEFSEKSSQNISSISPSSAMPPKLTHKNSNSKIESIMEEMELLLSTNIVSSNKANTKSTDTKIRSENNAR